MANRACTIDGCPRPYHGRGFCQFHYGRFRKGLDVNAPVHRPAPGIKRDCHCPRAKHVHGTVAAYQGDKCRCNACRKAQADRTNRRHREIGYGRWDVWRHPCGTQRRLQALGWLGYSSRAISAALGTKDTHYIQEYQRGLGKRVTIELHNKVAAVFDQLLAQPMPEGAGASRARIEARKRGYASPLAWDDIDDPDEEPQGTFLFGQDERLSQDELLREYAVLSAGGVHIDEIARKLGVNPKALRRKVSRPAA